MNVAADSFTGLRIWLRCRGRFVRTPGTFPEQQGRMVAAGLEAAGISVRILPVGERPRLPQVVASPERQG
jgi:hypothetical protein